MYIIHPGTSMYGISKVSSKLIQTYIQIASFSSTCGGGTASGANAINTRYCGARLGIQLASTTATGTHSPVCGKYHCNVRIPTASSALRIIQII